MPISRRHDFNYKTELSKLDYLFPKLKYAVLPSRLIRWLENFEEKDLPLVYDFLRVFEFIPYSEMQYRLEDGLKEIFTEIGENKKLLVVPFGKFGKSGTLVSYPLTHSPYYLKMEKAGKISITNDISKINEDLYDGIILLDDFIGTGNTFCEDYVKKDSNGESIESILKKNNIKNRFILSTIIMSEGQKKINKSFREIKIIAQIRNKIFDKNLSSMKIFGNANDYEILSNDSQSFIGVTKQYLNGYGSSESLIAFTHGTPNNTLPIFWFDNKKWVSLFPRINKNRMDTAREFKKEIAYYIGICNRLGIDLLTLENKVLKYEQDKFEKQNKYNSHRHHSIIALLKLKYHESPDYIISHILGLTDSELNEIYKHCINLKYIDGSRNITPFGERYFKRLLKALSKENFRAATDDSLKPKNIIYIPRSIGNMA